MTNHYMPGHRLTFLELFDAPEAARPVHGAVEMPLILWIPRRLGAVRW